MVEGVFGCRPPWDGEAGVLAAAPSAVAKANLLAIDKVALPPRWTGPGGGPSAGACSRCRVMARPIRYFGSVTPATDGSGKRSYGA